MKPMMTNETKASKAAATRIRNMTVAKLRAMTPKARRTFFNNLSHVINGRDGRVSDEETLERLTMPCNGEAHGNAFIDNCGVCLNVTWGRMLRPCDHTDCHLVSPNVCMNDEEV